MERNSPSAGSFRWFPFGIRSLSQAGTTRSSTPRGQLLTRFRSLKGSLVGSHPAGPGNSDALVAETGALPDTRRPE